MPSDDWMLRHAREQLKNELTAPRLKKQAIVPNPHFLKKEEKKEKKKKKDDK